MTGNGPGGLGQRAGLAGLPGKCPGKSLSFISVFYFLSVCFDFIKNARAFSKIMILLMATVWIISNSKHFSS